MMNDRFAAQLRRHLLESADERPADGQLEAALRLTASEPQYRPWAARLRMRPELECPHRVAASVWPRCGGVAARDIGRRYLVCGLASRRGNGLQGRWTSTDAADDSIQTLIVAAGSSPSVHFEDHFSINCERRGEPSTQYVADGAGEIDGGRLTVKLPERRLRR